MNVPTGVKIIFDGGSFSGALPSLCELKNSPVVVGTGTGVALTFQEGATLGAGSDLELSGGSVAITSATIAGALELSNVALSITTSLTVSGSLDTTGAGALSAPTLVKSGSGSIAIDCGAASGTTWNVTTIEADSIDVATLTTSGKVESDGDAEGTTWNVGGVLTVGGDCDVASLTTVKMAEITGDGTGTTWNLGTGLTPFVRSAIPGGDVPTPVPSVIAFFCLGNCDVATLTASFDVAIHRNATGTTWTTGALDVGGSFNVPTLTLNGASSVSLENVENLTLGASAVLTVSANSSIITLASLGGSAIVFSQASFLAVAESASLSSPTNVSGAGYFALPSSANASSLVAASGSDVRVCQYGAGVTRVDGIVDLNLTDITAAATRTDATKTFLAERKVNGVWELIDAAANGAFTTTTTGKFTELRTFDGVSFVTTTVYADDPRVCLIYVNAAALELVKAWTITTDYAFQTTWTITTDFIMASDYNYAGESPLLFARLELSGTSTLVTSADVSSIKYTCYKRSWAWGKETRTAVAGHTNVSIPLNTILSSLVTNDSRWTKDSTGYNFRYEPSTTTSQIFPEAGDYIIVITVTPTSGNPAPICYEITVK